MQFAGLEQQLKTNDNLTSLLSLQQSAQSTQALGFVGKTAVVHGSTTALKTASATSHSVSRQNQAYRQQHRADGLYRQLLCPRGHQSTLHLERKGNDGAQWPDGMYTMTATAADSRGVSVGVLTQFQGVVDSVDLTQTVPMLSISGQTYTVNQLKNN